MLCLVSAVHYTIPTFGCSSARLKSGALASRIRASAGTTRRGDLPCAQVLVFPGAPLSSRISNLSCTEY